MLSNFTPDVANLQNIIDVCLKNPFDIRSLSIVIDKMVEDGLDLEVYSKDILFQGFPDAIELGAALEAMTQQALPDGVQSRIATLTCIGVFVQACRKGSTVDDLRDAINLIGSLGIRPDDETMEYFLIPDGPKTYHIINDLIPKRKKFRSLLDIDMPYGLEADLSLPFRRSKQQDNEPFFEFQGDRFHKHSKALQKSIKGGGNREDLVNNLDDDDNSFYEEKDKSEFENDENDNDDNENNDVNEKDIIAKQKTIVKKTILPGVTTVKRTDKRSSNQREILKRLSDAYNRNNNK